MKPYVLKVNILILENFELILIRLVHLSSQKTLCCVLVIICSKSAHEPNEGSEFCVVNHQMITRQQNNVGASVSDVVHLNINHIVPYSKKCISVQDKETIKVLWSRPVETAEEFCVPA